MKKFKTSVQIFAFLLFILFISFNTGCKKDDNNGTADFKVSLKSSSSLRSSYESVNIDIQRVSIHTSTDETQTSGWFDLDVNPGIYDLLDYEAGNDTIIAFDPLLQVQTVSQIRLILGSQNTVVESGETYDLETPSGQTSGIKIQVHAELQADVGYKVVLAFDPDKSIVKTGNGKYQLKPVIKATVIQF